MRIFLLFLFIAFLISKMLYSQANLEMGLLPTINLNKKLSKERTLNFKTESKQQLYDNTFKYEYQRLDLIFAVTKKINPRISIGLGYVLRIEDHFLKNKTFQQLTLISRKPTFTLAHRLMSDQAFHSSQLPEFRFRYRLSTEIPIAGHTLDSKEFYILFHNEYLNSWQGGLYDLEIRAQGILGYVFSIKNKLELGLDYRIDSFLKSKAQNKLFLGINFYQSF